jgi:hypothetical protein
MENDRVYFGRRAGEERLAAMKAAHPRVRQAHLEMAARYDERLAVLVSSEKVAGANLTSVA